MPRAIASGRRSKIRSVDFRTDYIDIYQVHWPDFGGPDRRHCSNHAKPSEGGRYPCDRCEQFFTGADRQFMSVSELHTVQPPYNLFERQIDRDVLPYARDKHLNVFAYGSLCRGLLTGRMRPDTKFTGDDLRRSDPKFQPPRYAQYLNAVQQLDDLAQKRYGKHVIDLAVRWVLDQPGITAALWGARILRIWTLWRASLTGTSTWIRVRRSTRFCSRRSPIPSVLIHGAA